MFFILFFKQLYQKDIKFIPLPTHKRPSGEADLIPPDLPLHLALTLALHGLEEGFQALHLHVPVVELPPQVVNGDAVARVPVPQTLILLLLQTQLLLPLV